MQSIRQISLANIQESDAVAIVYDYGSVIMFNTGRQALELLTMCQRCSEHRPLMEGPSIQEGALHTLWQPKHLPCLSFITTIAPVGRQQLILTWLKYYRVAMPGCVADAHPRAFRLLCLLDLPHELT